MSESLEVERFNSASSWYRLLKKEFESDYYRELEAFLKKERENQIVYPNACDTFRAFELTPFEKVKVIILGQDPYHGPGQATGLSFSVPPGVKFPPSLRNIFKEYQSDLGLQAPFFGNLEPWAEQGVFLLNSALSVRKGVAGSHHEAGWHRFTDRVMKVLSDEKEGLVFILWGKFAQQKASLIDQNRHFILESPHPSPFSAHKGFFGSHPFSKTNALLEQSGKTPIHWSLD